MAHLLPHFLYAPGPRTSDIVECVKHFRAGRWQRLWNEGLKNAGKLRDKRARLTSRPQKRSDRAKDTYAQKCANKGNLRKAKNILTDDMTLAHGDETVAALRDLHHPGPPDFNRQHWLSFEETKARWDTPEGQEIIEQHFSLKALRAYFQGRPAMGAPDIDGCVDQLVLMNDYELIKNVWSDCLL